jgi:alkylation response protein AidB-like acyl-CoA dehydrogenase
MVYQPPVKDIAFALQNVVGLDGLPQASDLDNETIMAILDEAAKLAGGVLAPLTRVADEFGAVLNADGSVTTPKGTIEAYKQYVDSGWNAVPFNPEYGGQGLPWVLGFAVQEMWQGANTAFGLCPLLTQAAVEAIDIHGTQEQKDLYLAKLISGEWTGTMNLTEPQAGTDLAAIKSKATKQADGTYKIEGQKIFITYGEHDLAENIIHMVLARTPDAPEGIKGISMFIVPKILPDGTRNDLQATKLEHKLGIHGSPTCVMYYGEKGGAVGYLVGQENEGIKYMFTMMNNARLSVGLQGVAVAEAATQQAISYAKDRIQSTRLGSKDGARVAIIEHEDIRRSLLIMKAQVGAARMLTYEAAKNLDLIHLGNAKAKARADVLTPIVKAFFTDMSVAVASSAIQVHGGMGYIEETGIAQYYRDARILPIYEGANGIHGIDLMFRKLQMDGGVAVQDFLNDIDVIFAQLGEYTDLQAKSEKALAALRHSTNIILKRGAVENACVATAYLNAFGYLSSAYMWGRAVIAAKNLEDKEYAQSVITLAQVYATHMLPHLFSECMVVDEGAEIIAGVNSSFFA